MEKMSGKTFGKIDTAVDYPAGTDLTLTLDQPFTVDFAWPPTAATQISPELAANVQKLLSGAPQRVQSKTKKPGDPLNLILVGNSESFSTRLSKRVGGSKKVGHEVGGGNGSGHGQRQQLWRAPVSQLYLYGRAEDLAFEKMLNTFMKRHHLRLWRTWSRPPMAEKSGGPQPTTLVLMCTSAWSHTRLTLTWMRNAPRWEPI